MPVQNDTTVGLRVPKAWKDRVSAMASETGLGLSKLIRVAVEDLVMRLETSKDVDLKAFPPEIKRD